MTAGQTFLTILQFVIRSIHLLTRCCGVVAGLLLVLACLVVCQMVLIRYVFDASTIWQTEFVTFCIVGATLIGSPYVLLHKGHVNVDLLPSYLPAGGRLWLNLFTSIAACMVCITLAGSGGYYFYEAWDAGWTTESVWGPPLWIPLLSLPLGLGFLSLQYLAEILGIISEILYGETVPGSEGHAE